MRKLLGIGAVMLGVVGVLLCATAIGAVWWAAVTTTARLERAADRLDGELSRMDMQLARVEARLNAVRKDLSAVHEAAEAIAAESPDLPRVRAGIERLLDRFVPAFERVDALADSLGLLATGLRSVAQIVDELKDDPDATVRARNAAEKLDGAAESLNGLGARVHAFKSARAVQVTREIVTLAREAAAASEQLAEGLAAARQATSAVHERTSEWREVLVFWIRVAATASTLLWLWVGLGQLCMIGWGRGQLSTVFRRNGEEVVSGKRRSSAATSRTMDGEDSCAFGPGPVPDSKTMGKTE